MTIIYAGDTHGRVSAFESIDLDARERGASVVIQVGDFGVHFVDNCPVADWFRNREGGPTWITCGGNHDNWPVWRTMPEVQLFGGTVRELAPGCFFAERGTVLNLGGEKHLFFGGAESTDKHHRREGRDWWSEETPNYSEFTRFMDALEGEKPSVVITHDAPLSIPIWKYNRDDSPTPRNLENIFRNSAHLPARWYFGHHHINDDWEIRGVKFVCCGLHGNWHE
jgi:hypothetical protein